jgi:hypothetical protein
MTGNENVKERVVLQVRDDAIETPIYETHKRGRNWVAILRGKNAANLERDFLPMVGGTVVVSRVALGSALEFGADYISSGGIRHPCREYYVVVGGEAYELIVEQYDTAAKAIRAARAFANAINHDEEM